MNKVIILEGPDGSGKTTLAAYLVEKYGYEYRHEGPPPANEDKLHYYGRLLLEALDHDRPIVFDRFHLGELVYAPIKRFCDDLKYTGMFLMDRLIKASGTQLVLCLPPYPIAYKNWYDKFAVGNDYLKSNSLYFDSYYRFKALTAYHGFYNWSNPADDRSLKDRIQFYMEDKEVNLPSGCAGNPKAKYLIIGDVANHTSMDIPFFSMENSSGFLNQSLWDAGYQEFELAFTNANTIRGEERNLAEVHAAMENLQLVIALGAKAAVACEKYKLPYAQIQHPSSAKRFGNKRDEYTQLLKEKRID